MKKKILRFQKNQIQSFSLEKEERAVERALEKDEYVSVDKIDDSKKLFEIAVKNFEELQKTKPITIRVNRADLLKVKAKAARNGIPYQTLISGLIHQYAGGEIQTI